MPLYEYRCECGETIETTTRDNWITCPRCGGTARRRWSFQKPPQVLRHWNYSVGAWCEDKADFDRAMKAKAADQSERLGIDVENRQISHSEAGATDHGLKATHDNALSTGRTRPPVPK